MDKIIEESAGLIINQIFEKYGERYFRDLESDILKRELNSDKGIKIISCGGGIVLRPENIKLMKENGVVFFLSAKAETVFDRVKSSEQRPLLNNNMSIESIQKRLDSRLDLYNKAADFTVVTDNLTIEEVAEKIVCVLKKL